MFYDKIIKNIVGERYEFKFLYNTWYHFNFVFICFDKSNQKQREV